MTNEELWQTALGEIELSISKANFITWFKNTSILSSSKESVVIGVPNGFAKEWLENKYNIFIIRALRNFQPEIREVRCVICNPQESQEASSAKNVDAIKTPPTFHKITPEIYPSDTLNRKTQQETNLNPRYRFDNFIIGENNELARAACFAVSQNLGKVYNPLFIYGGVGLGKTHLLQSIGNEIVGREPQKKVLYITSERFATELIDSIKNQKISQFKTAYQQIDLLIIDDIQFLSGKEKTQQEFFHIFNTLYQFNKQIVISSDRPPKAISTLEERLRSRFEGGMIADIGRPDLETRMAILKAKATEKGFEIEEEAVKFIAENVKNNVREAEGALNKVIATAQLENKFPDLDFVGRVLSELISSGKRVGIQHQHVINTVSEFYNINPEELINKGRKKEVALARQIAMYLMRSELSASYPLVGEKFGGRDHTTALHAYEKISRELETNKKLKEVLFILREKLYSL